MEQINIGNTPLVRLYNFEQKNNIKAHVYGKLEYYNPTGSTKDRAAYQMIKDAFTKGLINNDSTIIEPTSGNTGIGLAYICNIYKLKCIIVMPSSMSKERIEMMEKYNAKVMLSDAKLGMQGSIDLANKLHNEIQNSFIPMQFENPSNPLAHYLTTAPELEKQLDNIDVLIAGIGTGGTISGISRYFKEKGKQLFSVGVEPNRSPLLTKGIAGPHKIQGIGANFIPKTLDQNLVDLVIAVDEDNSIENAKELAELENIYVGISSGAALEACKVLCQDKNYNDKNIVVILVDSYDRYKSVF